ncbi:MAG TPA: low temperature requirement protein A [Gammaproteobacteria bacterium]|nr:low temperature requirement protein A [Gammaproteobacteria bacterium]
MKKILQSAMDKHKVSWLELFYDLIYVVVIAKLAHLVTYGHDGHLGLTEFIVFIALFVPVWWAWTGHALYATRFYDDGVADRLLTLGQMFLVTLMSVYIKDAFYGEGKMFALSYAAIRALLVVMYLRVYFSNKEIRPVTSCLAAGFSVGASLWLISAFLPTAWMYAFWAAGLLVDFMTTFRCRPLLKITSVHKHHLPERFGLLILILLGESVASLTSALNPQDMTVSVLTIALLGFISLAAVWWHYFEVLERVVINRELGAAHLIIYGHLFIFIGLALFASALRQNIVGNLTIPDITLLFGVSITLYLLPVLLIAQQAQTSSERWPLRRNTLLLILLLVVIAVSRNRLNDLGISAIIASIMVIYVYLNTPKPSKLKAV